MLRIFSLKKDLNVIISRADEAFGAVSEADVSGDFASGRNISVVLAVASLSRFSILLFNKQIPDVGMRPILLQTWRASFKK